MQVATIEVSPLYTNVKYTISIKLWHICVHVHYVHTNVCINRNFQLIKCLSSWCLQAFSNIVPIKNILLIIGCCQIWGVNLHIKLNYGLRIMFVLQRSHRLKEDNVASKKDFFHFNRSYFGMQILHISQAVLKDLIIKFETLIETFIYWQYFQACFLMDLGLCVRKYSCCSTYILISSIGSYRILKVIMWWDKINK